MNSDLAFARAILDRNLTRSFAAGRLTNGFIATAYCGEIDFAFRQSEDFPFPFWLEFLVLAPGTLGRIGLGRVGA